mmetsp:Transcript_3499/g.5854  ORF Transcript_3499/g.5854 Transcript_3499/m.5854 type:complete len:96 (+) Transcript_3499:71-358(+)
MNDYYDLGPAEVGALMRYAPHADILVDCSQYTAYGAGNGVAPDQYMTRTVANELLAVLLPQSFDQAKEDKSIIRVMLHGSPGSRKTSYWATSSRS